MKRLDADAAVQFHEIGAHPDTGRNAYLRLGFARDGDTTRLTERAHLGPLRVQKPLYPEGPRVCHAIVVHPPGGVVGGDQLRIDARIGEHAAAFLTTPGAAKWYKANGRVSRQQVRLEAHAGAAIEWLPQETIFFDAAQVRLDTEVALGKDASYIGCEVLCFGRTASGESFSTGRIEQRTSIRRDGKLLWFEQGALEGGSGTMTSPLGLAGHTVCATLIAVGTSVAGAFAAQLREAAGPDCGVTQMKSLTVVRYLGDSSEAARQSMLRAWRVLRPALAGREAVMPRIWNT